MFRSLILSALFFRLRKFVGSGVSFIVVGVSQGVALRLRSATAWVGGHRALPYVSDYAPLGRGGVVCGQTRRSAPTAYGYSRAVLRTGWVGV